MDGPPPKMPSRNTVRVKMDGILNLVDKDPNKFYVNLKKIGAYPGSGAFGMMAWDSREI